MARCFAFAMLCCTLFFSAKAQEFSVTGIVRDLDETLIGASVSIKGTSSGVITDIDGRFTLDVYQGATIVVSFVGYETREVEISSAQNLDIVLMPSADQLDELVVIGYGTVKKSDLTGSVSSIKSEDFIKTAVSSIDQGLQGKAAGVVVSMASGQPGAKSSIRIRGTTSLYGDNEPLYVIDGVIIIPPAQGLGAVSGPALNPLENINPADVESIEVLKDASATAMYGARGANGVILVTTKRGETGKTNISIGYTQSWQELRKKIPMLNAAELAILGNEAADNSNVDRRQIYASPTNLGVGTDWQEEIFQVAPIHNVQVAARGGSKGSTFAISGSYLNQEGIIINSNYERWIARINLDREIHEKVTIGTSTNLSRSNLFGTVTDHEGATPSSVTSWALIMNPGLPVKDENGEYTFENNTAQPTIGNPVQDAMENQQVTLSTRILGNFYAKWDITDWLSFKTSPSTELTFTNLKTFTPNNILRGEANNGQASLGEVDGINRLWENTLSANKTFSSHSISAVVGYTLQKYTNESVFLATSDFDDNRLGFYAVQAGKLKTLVVSSHSEEQMQSFLGRINYGFRDKYLITASARVDGSSKFGAGNKYGFFPSLAFAWRAKDEPFLEDVSFISDLKLRASFGVVGNQGIPAYSSLGLLTTTEAYFGENDIAKGSGQLTRQNDDLKWEQTDQFDVGLDIAFLSNRIQITADVYYRETSDLLVDIPLPYTSGFKGSFINVGSMKNKGFEVTINSVNTTGKLEWRSGLTVAQNRNRVLNLNRDEPIPVDPLFGVSAWTFVTEGKAVNTLYGYETDGIVQLSEDPSTIPHFSTSTLYHGDRKYKDQNEDGVIDEKDRVKLGNANPDFSFGLNNTVNYGSLSLSIFIQGVVGNEIANFNKLGLESFDGTQNNSRAALKRWTPENQSNEYPRASLDPKPNVLSDHQVEDGSYLRVKDITLSYEMKNLFGSKVEVGSCKVFVSVKNLVTITNYSGYDPEVNRFVNDTNPLRFGADAGSYPTAKIYSTGINITF